MVDAAMRYIKSATKWKTFDFPIYPYLIIFIVNNIIHIEFIFRRYSYFKLMLFLLKKKKSVYFHRTQTLFSQNTNITNYQYSIKKIII